MHSLTLKKTPLCHQVFQMVLLRDLIGKNVWDSYLGDSRRPQIKLQRVFCVIPAISHHDFFYLLNGLVWFSNVSRSKML